MDFEPVGSAWDPQRPISDVSADDVCLIDGSSFCLSGRGGDITASVVNGLFVADTRVLSRWQLTVDGQRPRVLTALTPDPFRGIFLGMVEELVVERHRRVEAGLHEQIVVRNHRPDSVDCTVTIDFAADFADLFEVKDGRVPHRATSFGPQPAGGVIALADGTRRVVLSAPGAVVSDGTVTFHGRIAARAEWTVRVEVSGSELPSDRGPELRQRDWDRALPRVEGSLASVLQRSARDLGSLRIPDPEHPERMVVAAGAPWFMALFGRDALLTASMALPLDPQLALGTLRTLARYQGTRSNPVTEEQPGRILHELRFGLNAAEALGGAHAYCGTADATPLFVVLLDELARWGVSGDAIAELLPHADRALDWITRYGDRDGDGFVEYERSNANGLINQGWKDSGDAISHPDGTIAAPPIALCEVQGYVYAAYRARAHLADLADDAATAELWSARAATLRAEFNERFWLPDRGWFAIALDGDKRPVEACASNMGHCLMSGIIDEELAGQVVAHLMSEQMFTGWGIRTLSTEMGAYNPASYHNGSVWPHDNALIVAGFVRYGFLAEAQRVATGLIEAAGFFDGRLPELFCGFDRSDHPEPIPYPTSCSPQAWAAATPIHLLRSLLRFDPCLPHRQLHIDPALPPSWGPLRISRLGLGDDRISLDVEADRWSGRLPPNLTVTSADLPSGRTEGSATP